MIRNEDQILLYSSPSKNVMEEKSDMSPRYTTIPITSPSRCKQVTQTKQHSHSSSNSLKHTMSNISCNKKYDIPLPDVQQSPRHRQTITQALNLIHPRDNNNYNEIRVNNCASSPSAQNPVISANSNHHNKNMKGMLLPDLSLKHPSQLSKFTKASDNNSNIDSNDNKHSGILEGSLESLPRNYKEIKANINSNSLQSHLSSITANNCNTASNYGNSSDNINRVNLPNSSLTSSNIFAAKLYGIIRQMQLDQEHLIVPNKAQLLQSPLQFHQSSGPNYLQLMNDLRKLSRSNDYCGYHAANYAQTRSHPYNITTNTNIMPRMPVLEEIKIGNTGTNTGNDGQHNSMELDNGNNDISKQFIIDQISRILPRINNNNTNYLQ